MPVLLRALKLPLALASLALLSACDEASRAGGSGSASAGPSIAVPTPAPDSLGRELSLAELWQSDAAAQFAYVTDVDVDAMGRVFVADASLLSVTVLSTKGARERTVGQKGSGPGEFRGIGSVQLGGGDTLFVFDNILQRLSAFRAGDDSLAYTRFVGEQGTGAPERAYRVHAGSHLVASYMAPVHARSSDAQFAERQMVVRLLGVDGAIVRDSLLTGIGRSNLFRRSGEMISVGTNAFGRQPIVRVSRTGQVFYARSDSVGVLAVGLDGTRSHRCRLSVASVAVRTEDLKREQALTSPRLRDALADSMPATWPPLADFIVDDREGVWLGLTGPGGRADRWAWCDASGELRGFVRLPEGASLAAVRGERLYAVWKDEDQVPFIRAYRMIDPPSEERTDGRE